MSDHIQDKNHSELYRIYSSMDVPDYVKEAGLLSPEDRMDIFRESGSGAFADRANGTYPISSKADTWLSIAFFSKSAHKDPSVETTLKAAATLWGIDYDSVSASSVTACSQKEASGGASRVFFGEKSGECPSVELNSLADIEKTASFLAENPQKFNYMARKCASRQLLSFEESLGGGMDPEKKIFLEKTAGYGTSSLEDALRVIRARKPVYRGRLTDSDRKLEEMEEILLKTATDTVNPPVLEKIATVLDAMDRFSEMHTRYGDTFQPPERELFRCTSTGMDAFQKNAVEMSDGSVFLRQDVLMYAPELKDLLDNLGIAKEASDASLPMALTALTGAACAAVVRFLNSRIRRS